MSIIKIRVTPTQGDAYWLAGFQTAKKRSAKERARELERQDDVRFAIPVDVESGKVVR